MLRSLLFCTFFSLFFGSKAMANEFRVDGAGIVLAHVFIPTYLDRLKIDPKTKPYECVRSLEVLIFDDLATEVNFKGLLKVMCGLHPTSQLVPTKEPDVIHQRTAETLVLSMILHWHELNSTSTSGFRNTFFFRDGKLIKTSNGWELTISKGPYDTLLQTAPFPLNQVDFSWMNIPIKINW